MRKWWGGGGGGADRQAKYEFEVAMSCEGCVGAVSRVLKKLDGRLPGRGAGGLRAGVNSFDVSLEKQSVLVDARDDLAFDTVRERIARTGKEIKGGSTVA